MMTRMDSPPSVSDVREAATRLEPHIRETPLERVDALGGEQAGGIFLKLENLQRTGSFKLRGALNAVLTLPEDRAAAGVVTASAGNHGLGVALAGKLAGVRATVFVPERAPETKRTRIAALGADLRLVSGGYEEAHEAALAHAAENSAHYLHAFSDPDVVAGQGTVALEILARVPAPGTIVVPVGGGGLIGGIGLVMRELAPAARIVGVQTPATRSMHDSLSAGRVLSPPIGETLCDGLAGDVDERSFRLAREVVDEMILVSEDDVRSTMAFLYRQEGIVVEGSGAVAVAALRSGQVKLGAGPTVAVITGGNVDLPVLISLLQEHPVRVGAE